ncbi:hypothetical protein GWM83_00375 [Candidatus Bathyarchaeota archaeon]|nr:hypothetical protein [Candidatus Bathyarchaeota archaeon]
MPTGKSDKKRNPEQGRGRPQPGEDFNREQAANLCPSCGENLIWTGVCKTALGDRAAGAVAVDGGQ